MVTGEDGLTGSMDDAGEEQTPISTQHYVYMLRCADGTLYTGYTNNITRRVAMHNAGKGGHYTRSHRPVVLVAQWSFDTKREALQAEYKYKQLSRAQKLQLIENE